MNDPRAHFKINPDGRIAAVRPQRFTWGSLIYIHNESRAEVAVRLQANNGDYLGTGFVVAAGKTCGWCPVPPGPTGAGNWGDYRLAGPANDVAVNIHALVIENGRVLPAYTAYEHGEGHWAAIHNGTGERRSIYAYRDQYGDEPVTDELFEGVDPGQPLVIPKDPAHGSPHAQPRIKQGARGEYWLTLQRRDGGSGPIGGNDGKINVGGGGGDDDGDCDEGSGRR